MVRRCSDPTIAGFERYGGRGIKVCDKWLNFQFFLDDMGEPPNGKTLDRIDNDGDYVMENCRWATPKEQAANRRCKIVAEKDLKEIGLVEDKK